ncbi:hypothetical protein ColKHC_01521 [Colletotrichum higginsianum]|nr:hypothetical protein ColKHC_01521 [Colletotrichum higginsianum]
MSYGIDLTMFGPLAPEATATDQDAMNENMFVKDETEVQGEGIPPTSTRFTAQYAQMDAVGLSQPSITPWRPPLQEFSLLHLSMKSHV